MGSSAKCADSIREDGAPHAEAVLYQPVGMKGVKRDFGEKCDRSAAVMEHFGVCKAMIDDVQYTTVIYCKLQLK